MLEPGVGYVYNAYKWDLELLETSGVNLFAQYCDTLYHDIEHFSWWICDSELSSRGMWKIMIWLDHYISSKILISFGWWAHNPFVKGVSDSPA